MFNKPNASIYANASNIYIIEFKQLLAKIVLCYNRMIADSVVLENDENKIRDKLLLNYLKNDTIRHTIQLEDFLFDREVYEDNSLGRTDIKVQTKDSFKKTAAYYIIECKRLNNINVTGKTGLNGKYVINGINRFVTGNYSSYYKVNGMIGFIVDDLDTDNNHSNINTVMQTHYPEIHVTQPLTIENFIPAFKYQYSSKHTTNNNHTLILYHLMFDVSKNIQEN